MKLTFTLLTFVALQVSASGYSQKITLSVKDAHLGKVFELITRQSGYEFFYNKEQIQKSRPVTVQIKEASVEEALNTCLKDQPFTYTIVNKVIVIKTLNGTESRELSPSREEKRDAVPIDVNGAVVNEMGEAVGGVTVTVKGTKIATSTNSNGEFSLITVDPDAILVFTSVNMETFELRVSGKTELRINLKTKITALGNVQIIANTGYQTVKPNEVTGSLTAIDNKTLNQQVGSNILTRLDGVASGVLFPKQQLQGGPNFIIRGFSTINGPKNPLIVLDNFPYDGDINNINPNDIESITVLKDAAATAIWGAQRGANGVIVITTKKGRLNQPLKVNLNTNIIVSQEQDLSLLRTISPSEYIDVEKFLFNQGYYDSYINDTWSYPALSPVVEILDKGRAGLLSASEATTQINTYRNIDTRNQYQKYMYQKPVTQQYAINLSGGSNNIAYYLSVGYDKTIDQLDANGDRITIRSDNSYKPLKNLLISLGVQYTQSKSGSGKPGYGSIRTGQWQSPYLQFADANGNVLPVATVLRDGYTDTAGAGKLQNWKYYPLDDYKHNKTTTNLQDISANIGLNYQLIKGLSVDIKYQYERQNSVSRNLQDLQSFAARDNINMFSQLDWTTGSVRYIVPLGSILSLSNSTLESQNLRGQFNLNRSWNKHNIIAIAGSEIRNAHTIGNSSIYYGYNDNTLVNSNVDLVNTYPTYLNGDLLGIGSTGDLSDKLNRFVSVFGNAAYTYNNKYTFSISARRDASNLFGVNSNNKWNPLWSVGGAWDISQEPFYKVSWLPYLKFRTTFGFSGNTDAGRAALLTFFAANVGPPTNFDISLLNNFPNPGVRWEKSRMINIGFDFQTKKQVISGSIETYFKRGIDLYGAVPFDPTAGLQLQSTITKNVANMEGKGIDITINSKNIDKDLKWYSTLLFGYNINKTTNYYVDSNRRSGSFISSGIIINPLVGQPLYSIVALKWAGLDANGNPQGYWNKEVSTDYNNILLNTGKEDLIYKQAVPVFFGSIINTFNYKGFTLTANISYRLGYYFMKPTINYSTLFDNGANIGTSDFSNRWQSPGDENRTNIPSMIYPASSDRDALYNYAEINILKADNIKLQYIHLSYDFDKRVWKNIPFQNIQLYINTSNLGILWKANKEGIDPDYISSPINGKTYAIGVRAIF